MTGTATVPQYVWVVLAANYIVLFVLEHFLVCGVRSGKKVRQPERRVATRVRCLLACAHH
jgi:hypothetical protein